MTIKYSFSRVWKIAFGVICAALFLMSSVGFIFAQRMHHEFKNEMTSQIQLLTLTTDVVYEISEVSAGFGNLLVHQELSPDVSNCVEHLNSIRQYMDSPGFAGEDLAEFRQVLQRSEIRLRTMLYAYRATNFADPARDRAQESLLAILNIIRGARQLALNQCRQTQTDIARQTENLVKLTERARLYLYIALFTGLVAVISVVLYLGKELRKRLQYIIDAADCIGSGNTAFRIRMKFDDEVGRVAHRFDSMAEEIERKEMQLNNSNRILADALDEARQSSVMKSEFLANVTHEIRTPMNAVIGFTSLLLEDQITEEQRRYLMMVHTASTNLMEIINSILDFSKIEAGRMNVNRQDCSLDEIVCYVDSLMIPAAQKKHIQFKVIRCDGLPSEIKTDPLRIRQCLINLVNNAVKFTQNGYVYLSLALENRDDSQWLRFDVEDTGIGIPANKLDLIFEPFRQADDSTSRHYGGTGLGLSITRKLAELMGGSVSVKSTAGVGSVFTLLLPISSAVEIAEKTLAVTQTQESGQSDASQEFDDSPI
jgi:signal transduction histidine kinase